MAELSTVDKSSERESEVNPNSALEFQIDELECEETEETNVVTKIYTCKKCWRPLGDSRDVIFTGVDAIVLKAVTYHVEKCEEKLKSPLADHFDSTFQLLNCKECNNYIGEFYISTPRLLMYKRDHFSLCLNAIDSYTLEESDKQFGPRYENKVVLDSYDFLMEQLQKTQRLLGVLQKNFPVKNITAPYTSPPMSSECVVIPL